MNSSGQGTESLIQTKQAVACQIEFSGWTGDWNEAFDLQSGTYTVVESNHGFWTCTIVVQ
jgi:hypothetical protein